MALENFRITSFASFQAVTKDPRQVARLYFYQQLDCLIELAYLISVRFFEWPHLFINLNSTTAGPPLREVLARLRGRYGYDEHFPSSAARDEIYVPIFGRGGAFWRAEHGDFPRLRDALVSAAKAFAEHALDKGLEALRDRVRIAVGPFRNYLLGLYGDSIKWSAEGALPGLTEDVAYAILRNHGVSCIFGISEPPTANFPYAEDKNGDKLVESLARQLECPHPTVPVVITREAFTSVQQAAKRGAETIATILEFQENASVAELDLLISKAYSWGASVERVAMLAAPAGVVMAPSVGTKPAPARTILYGIPGGGAGVA